MQHEVGRKRVRCENKQQKISSTRRKETIYLVYIYSVYTVPGIESI